MNFDPVIPIWIQVATALKQDMLTGRLPPGGKLPGGRELALQYSINPNTAARVYQELERAGLCETRRGLGTFVTEDTERLRHLRDSMAQDALRRFLKSLEGLGMTPRDAMQMLKEEITEC